MIIKPLFERILLKPIMAETTSKSGLLLTLNEEKTTKAIVHTVGVGETIDKSGLKPGDVVLYNKYAGEPYKVGGVEYTLIEVTEITAIIVEE